MISTMDNPDFTALLTSDQSVALLNSLSELQGFTSSIPKTEHASIITDDATDIAYDKRIKPYLTSAQQQWNIINAEYHSQASIFDTTLNAQVQHDYESAISDWLISLFNQLFSEQNVELVRGDKEPEYFPAKNNSPARIEFAHGFFASALHELSHWCIAGKKRRQLPDYGYWYAPDGRNAAQQRAFEQLEIKPQALECLFTLACKRHFQVSQDNLFADFDTTTSTFAADVYQQALQYIQVPQTLPRDAKVLLWALLWINIYPYSQS